MMDMKARLATIARGSEWFWQALLAVRSLNLRSALSDVDVAHFEAFDLSAEGDTEIQRRLINVQPLVPWEVTNQAAVRTGFEAAFGHPVSPLMSLEDAVASWPEFATSVGLTLRDDDSIDVIAPYGLDDLFDMVVRRNPARISVATYRMRVEQKQYREPGRK